MLPDGAGGGLEDKGHCDAGSTLTLSVLLSDPADAYGGVFSTTDHGVVSPHEVARGDGIVFNSEMVHNVTNLRSGTRTSLVIEWWTRPANRHDRFR